MRTRIRRTAVIRVTTFAVAMAITALGFSQTNVAQESKNDLTLPQDRSLEQQFEIAQKAIESSNFSAAAIALRQIMSLETDFLTRRDESTTLVPARHQVLQLAGQLPVESRERLYAEWDRLAALQWPALQQTGTRDEIALFVNRHEGSLLAVRGLQWLANIYRDTGRHGQAAMAWQRIAGHPRATNEQRVIAQIARVESYLAAGRVDQALQAAHEVTSPAPIVIAGQLCRKTTPPHC